MQKLNPFDKRSIFRDPVNAIVGSKDHKSEKNIKVTSIYKCGS